jgi:tRNA A-37 threonylcarbamoyl transferase component Bud32
MQPGSKINDRYEIIRLLGEGGMGNVYLVKDFVESRIVALKLIKDKFFSNKAIDRFKNEFKLVSALKHPNIIKVYDLDVYKETDTYFFTMEFVEGENLTTAFPNLSYKEKLEILLQIARGLNYIHNRHIIHFDIKTDNIFLIKEKNSYKAKVMDFGLANLVEDFSSLSKADLENAPVFKLASTTVDLGKMPGSTAKEVEFKFTNAGKSDLVVRHVRSTCGCTAIQQGTLGAGIKPGQSSSIKATFNSGGYKGRVTKAIYVYTNDPKNSEVVLMLNADVEQTALK